MTEVGEKTKKNKSPDKFNCIPIIVLVLFLLDDSTPLGVKRQTTELSHTYYYTSPDLHTNPIMGMAFKMRKTKKEKSTPQQTEGSNPQMLTMLSASLPSIQLCLNQNLSFSLTLSSQNRGKTKQKN